MRRLYILLPNAERCRRVIADFQRGGIDIHYLHVIGNPLVDMEGLPKAGVLDASEVAQGAELGLLIGAIAGLIGAWLVVHMPPPGVELTDGSLQPYWLLGIAGAIFGAFVAAIQATGIPNHRLRAFQKAIDEGYLLLLIDIPRSMADKARHLVSRLDPETSLVVSRLPNQP